jgi:hypothetical protein
MFEGKECPILDVNFCNAENVNTFEIIFLAFLTICFVENTCVTKQVQICENL